MTDFALATPEAIASMVKGGDAVVLEAHFSSIDHPLAGDLPVFHHLPGAIQVHPSYLEAGTDESKYYPFYECPEDGNLLPQDRLLLALEALGLSPGRPAIVYGTEPDGTMAAARLTWGLMMAGVRTVRLLDGGLKEWMSHGGLTVPVVQKAIEVAGRPGVRRNGNEKWEARDEYRATTAYVRDLCRGRRSAKLVDVRKFGEYNGTLTSYYPFYDKAGHIPGAVSQGDWDTLVDAKTQRLGPCLERVRKRWRDLGIVDEGVESGETELVFYCGTGWRSSISFLVAILLGYRARNYDDGFYGWTWDDRNEIVVCESPP